MTSTTITTRLDNYQPSIDLATIPIWDALKLVELLKSVSTIINAAIDDKKAPAVQKYLDDWQALFNETVFSIADVVKDMEPGAEKERRARNWILLSVRLACAEGLMDLTGPGADEYDDEFSRQLIRRAS